MDSETFPWHVAVQLKKFLTISECPPRWKDFDLYLFRDEATAFYAGQSYCAFERVWEHIRGGPHGHSIMGRFVLCNWPISGRFTVEMWNSRSSRFAGVANNLDASERMLIEDYRPCFNIALNGEPIPLPAGYLPPNAPIKYLKNYSRMLREAKYTARADPADLDW